MTEKMKSNVHQGRGAEYIAAGQLMLRGASIAWPATDTGFDFIAGLGCRVQVKSAHLRTTPAILKTYPEGVYTFGLVKRGNYSPIAKRRAETVKFSDRCDIVVFYGIDQNRFWIAPATLVDDVHGVYLGVESDRSFDKDMPEILEMQRLGYTQKEIGLHFGITGPAVSVRLSRMGKPTHTDTASYKVRQCENAWEHILNFGVVQSSAPMGIEIP